MNRKQLVFPNTANAWDFITVARISNVDVEEATVSGFFTDSNIELACQDYGATLHDAPVTEPVIAPAPATAATLPPEPEAELVGKSGKTYTAHVYTAADHPADLPHYGIVCLALGAPQDGKWHYMIQSVFYTDQVQHELERFRQRADLTHFLVIPVKKGDVKGVEDLIQHYLHQ